MAEPTPIKRAVALRYQQEQEDAPRVLAKGAGPVAERIIALAKENRVPLHEDHDLVKLLATLELDVQVPPALYAALAEVLAMVYRANAKKGSGLR